ncbi:MAG: acyl-CoA synthetase FdrA [Candidatus Hodarchaeales archaeon]
MIVKTLIRKNEYRDSVQLMQAASEAMKLEGIDTASLFIGTDNNKKILAESGLITPEVEKASPNDIIVAIRAVTESNAITALDVIINKLTGTAIVDRDLERTFKSTRSALTSLPEANLVVISVPGEYATREAQLAIENGRNVFLFSDNVSIEEEIALKKSANEKNLIVMGPDCGTSIISGKGIGFANVVKKGSIGLVGASGTGLQEVTSLTHIRGRGVSHAIGTGSRDVKDSIGGISTITGLNALSNDPITKVIVVVSKPPEKNTMHKILRHIQSIEKPVVVNFLGVEPSIIEKYNLINASTLEAAAYISCAIDEQTDMKQYQNWDFDKPRQNIDQLIQQETKKLSETQQYIRGLYAGGTFTYEAALILSNLFLDQVFSNVSGSGIKPLPDLQKSLEHTIIDLGDDTFTIGKPHPMIDQTYRKQRFLHEASDPSTAVIMLDFVLGYGAHLDPIGDMNETLEEIRAKDNYVTIIAHICGTELDPQDWKKSFEILQKFNVITMPTNVQAVRLAALIVSRGTADVWK